MIVTPLRWQRLPAAAAVGCALLLSSCSGDSPSPAAPRPTALTPSPAPTADPAAVAALTRAVALTRRVRSYAFVAVQTVSGPSTQRTVLTGRAVRPSSIAYDLVVGTSRQQVIKIGNRTFVRVPPARFKAIAKTTPVGDPLASLLPLLEGIQNPTLTGSVITGTVTPATLGQAKLAPASSQGGADAPLRLTLDARGRVASVAVTLKITAGNQALTLVGTTQFSQYEGVAPIAAPGVLKR